jgi:hypothetical protein
MALVLCEVRPGLGQNDASVGVEDVRHVRSFLHVDLDFLTRQHDRTYLPVGLVYQDAEKGVALIELPFEADSGTWRLWVPLSSLGEANGGCP